MAELPSLQEVKAGRLIDRPRFISVRQKKRGSDTASEPLVPESPRRAVLAKKPKPNQTNLVSQNSQGDAPAREAGAGGADTTTSWSSEANPHS